MKTRFYLDTEFIEDGRTIDLISIGVVSDSGAQFYAESSNADWDKANAWVLASVRPHLTGPVLPRWQIATKLVQFVGESDPEFWGYYADYDWVAVCQLFGTMMQLPKGWPKYCMDLKQLAVSLGDPQLPKQKGVEHHALADALWNKGAHEWLGRYAALTRAVPRFPHDEGLCE